jgi:hypothetical protein
MTHIAFSESLDGKSVDWLELVTDAQYSPQAAEDQPRRVFAHVPLFSLPWHAAS